MNATEHSVLKIYASSTDRVGFDLLYEYVVAAAKRKGIAGVDKSRGIMGFGLSSRYYRVVAVLGTHRKITSRD